MAQRKIVFENKRYYHVFNRGVDKKIIFHNEEDMKYFLHRIDDFNNDRPVGGSRIQQYNKYKQLRGPASKLVKIVAFCLLPNHFHLLLRQNKKDGIAKFMQRVLTGYAMYYNKKYERTGALFQGRFKATELSGIGSLQMLSVYVNLNYKHHGIDPEKKMVKSSLGEYLRKNLKYGICSQKEIQNVMGELIGDKKQAYIKYSKMQSKYFVSSKNKNTENIRFKEFEK